MPRIRDIAQEDRERIARWGAIQRKLHKFTKPQLVAFIRKYDIKSNIAELRSRDTRADLGQWAAGLSFWLTPEQAAKFLEEEQAN